MSDESNATKPVVWSFPTRLIFGAGARAELPVEVKALGGTKVLVVTDPGVNGAGLVEPPLGLGRFEAQIGILDDILGIGALADDARGIADQRAAMGQKGVEPVGVLIQAEACGKKDDRHPIARLAAILRLILNSMSQRGISFRQARAARAQAARARPRPAASSWGSRAAVAAITADPPS